MRPQVVIEEFQALYGANNTRVSERNALLFGVVTFAGALLAIAVQGGVLPKETGLLYPVITFFLAMAFMHNPMSTLLGVNSRRLSYFRQGSNECDSYDSKQPEPTPIANRHQAQVDGYPLVEDSPRPQANRW